MFAPWVVLDGKFYVWSEYKAWYGESVAELYFSKCSQSSQKGTGRNFFRGSSMKNVFFD